MGCVNTGSHHLIALWPNAMFMVDGSPLVAGSQIGVFYADEDGNWVCAINYLEWFSGCYYCHGR